VVLALDGGRFKSTTVTLGQITDGFAEVLSGLDSGDQVVTSAQFLLDSESNKHAGLRHLSPATEEPDPAADQHQPVDHSQMMHH
jgi:membrane fusion protein, copper/silver efflux system